ncbi:hypothetical protein AAEU29_11255 [Pseudoalteromonas sp. SSM20]|uniref:hypothetical protein n=1 Tax=Pseudoalteromonas sp. SSM20 TaxID=3139394 RepID=UPI003BAD3C4C
MKKLLIGCLWLMSNPLFAEQIVDANFTPKNTVKTFQSQNAPKVTLDAAHFNFHTLDDRYKPFGKILEINGFNLTQSTTKFSKEQLDKTDILVIANALNEKNVKDWDLPNFSAFSRAEIDAEGWLQGATLEFHKGRIAVFGEAAMFTAQLSGEKDQQIKMGLNAEGAEQNEQFLLNVMHWLTRKI